MGAEDASKTTYENPLIPNARLRQIYLAMLKARMLEKALPAGRRGFAVGAARGHAVGMSGLEACLVSTSVDLGPGDLVSDAVAGGVVDFLRGESLDSALRPGKTSRRRAVLAECGAAGRLASGLGIAERLWVGLGAAAGLKALAARSNAWAGANKGTPRRAGVVVMYVRSGEASTGVWKKALEFAAKQELPIFFVVMPGARGAKAGGLSALALRCSVPGIAVDGDDAVAIYRVAQEAIGRARAGGGAALMECVPFVVEGSKAKAGDGVRGLEEYMVGRGVCTRRWLEAEARRFGRVLNTA